MGNGLQGISRCWQCFCNGNARKAPEPHSCGLPGASRIRGGAKMEIALRQINRAAVFRNEGLGVAVLAGRIVELETRAACKPDCGNGFVIECRGEFIEA